MRRVLDELADAFDMHDRRKRPKRVVASTQLVDQFELPVSPSLWQRLVRALRRSLPPLKPDGENWAFPYGWTSVWDLAEHLAQAWPDLEPPHEQTVAEAHEARVYARVRYCLSEALNVDPEEVVRSARLVQDLDAN